MALRGRARPVGALGLAMTMVWCRPCITGSFFIESIFSIPGIGQYYVTAVNNQDLSIVLGETVLLSILYIAVIFITDILYVFVDPRIQMPGKRSK